MSWQTSKSLLQKRLAHYGLSESVQAGLICDFASALHPELLEVLFLRKNALHVKVLPGKKVAFTMIRGKFLSQVQEFAKEKNLPVPQEIRLTFLPF